VPPFNENLFAGGAEIIAASVVRSLAIDFNVVVFHGEPDNSAALGKIRHIGSNVTTINAFFITDAIINNGVISFNFCNAAKEMLINTVAAICFERCGGDIPCKQICVLGGISYKHCRDVAGASYWEKLIVPSAFVKRKCVEINQEREASIIVIPNGIDTTLFFDCNSQRENFALLPFRPDWGKGYLVSVDFISILNKIQHGDEYKLLITRSDTNVFAEQDFYTKLDNYARTKNVEIKYLSWEKHEFISKIYNLGKMTLLLGDLEEGFGLCTIESVLCGTPVVARAIGATVELMPNYSGVVFWDGKLSEESIERIFRIVANINKRELSSTAEFIRKNYDLRIMSKAYLNFLIKELN